MVTAQQQLSQVRRLQAFATEEAVESDRLNALGFVLEVDPPRTRSSLLKDLSKHLPDIKFKLESVFDDDPAPQFFRIEFSAVSFDEISGSFFEIAYFLKDALGLISCDADIECDFHPWKYARDEGDTAEAKMFGTPLGGLGSIKQLCFLSDDNDSKPKDEGWAARVTKVDEARAAYGVTGHGVILAQIDTGVAKHDELGNLKFDESLGFNLYNSAQGAIDPLKNRLLGFFDQKGHGTATSAVIVSEGGFIEDGEKIETTPPGLITGVAPNVTFMPIRAIRSVLRISQGRVAKAVDLARRKGAHIITMSLGGAPSRALSHAIARAVKENIIVMAAAGNCVKKVVYPAAYDHCIAVAAVNRLGKRWRGSSRGPEVDFSAPGEFVWTASRKNSNDIDLSKIGAGQGTSFSVALSAGIAALWLERHNREVLITSLNPRETLQSRFRAAVKETAILLQDWPSATMGGGIINAMGLMEVGAASLAPPLGQTHTSRSTVNTSLQTISDSERVSIFLNTISADPHFGGAFNGQDSIADFDTYSAEILWRLIREQQRSLRANDPAPLPARSTYLEAMLKGLLPTQSVHIP